MFSHLRLGIAAAVCAFLIASAVPADAQRRNGSGSGPRGGAAAAPRQSQEPGPSAGPRQGPGRRPVRARRRTPVAAELTKEAGPRIGRPGRDRVMVPAGRPPATAPVTVLATAPAIAPSTAIAATTPGTATAASTPGTATAATTPASISVSGTGDGRITTARGLYVTYGYSDNSGYGAGAGEAGLKVEVKPKTAEVYVDGRLAGIVDQFDGMFQSLSVEPGGHEITVYHDGFRSIRQQLYLGAGSTFRIKGALEPLAPGEPNEPRPQPAAAAVAESQVQMEPEYRSPSRSTALPDPQAPAAGAQAPEAYPPAPPPPAHRRIRSSGRSRFACSRPTPRVDRW